jgi:hypothetical protein
LKPELQNLDPESKASNSGPDGECILICEETSTILFQEIITQERTDQEVDVTIPSIQISIRLLSLGNLLQFFTSIIDSKPKSSSETNKNSSTEEKIHGINLPNIPTQLTTLKTLIWLDQQSYADDPVVGHPSQDLRNSNQSIDYHQVVKLMTKVRNKTTSLCKRL